MGTLNLGADTFVEAPGAVETRICKVCGAVCNVERNLPGRQSMGHAMAGMLQDHDLFTCPSIGQEWHQRAAELRNEIRESPSEKPRAVKEEELAQLITQHMPDGN